MKRFIVAGLMCVGFSLLIIHVDGETAAQAETPTQLMSFDPIEKPVTMCYSTDGVCTKQGDCCGGSECRCSIPGAACHCYKK